MSRIGYIRLFLLCLCLPLAARAGFAQDEMALARHHYELGRRLYNSGQTARAIEELYTATSIHETYPKAQLLLAQALIDAERLREALGTLKGVEERRRKTAPVQKLYGKVLCRMNRLEQAERSLRAAIELADRPDAELHYLLGLVRLRQESFWGAKSEAERALEISPHYRAARRLLSDAYLMLRRFPEAGMELRRCLKEGPGRAEAQELRRRLAIVSKLSGADQGAAASATPQIHYVPQAAYTEKALRNHVEGTVSLEVLFGSDGRVQQVLVARGLGFGLDEEAMRVAHNVGFTPGHLDGKPVSVWAAVVVRFNIRDRAHPGDQGDGPGTQQR
ncbi:MAG TPA: TonB family protein [Blastocatellia bacterium]|nr:TonB family protein [Blastocatellia bacterium]